MVLQDLMKRISVRKLELMRVGAFGEQKIVYGLRADPMLGRRVIEVIGRIGNRKNLFLGFTEKEVASVKKMVAQQIPRLYPAELAPSISVVTFGGMPVVIEPEKYRKYLGRRK